MDIIRELESLDQNLTSLKGNFNNQMNAIEGDLKEFHKHLIALSAKYPEQKELLEFIVFINDRIETNQTNFKEVLSESINELIVIKKQIVKENVKSRKNYLEDRDKKGFFGKFMNVINILKDMKWIITAIVLLVVVTGFIFVPDTMVKAFTYLIEIGF